MERAFPADSELSFEKTRRTPGAHRGGVGRRTGCAFGPCRTNCPAAGPFGAFSVGVGKPFLARDMGNDTCGRTLSEETARHFETSCAKRAFRLRGNPFAAARGRGGGRLAQH